MKISIIVLETPVQISKIDKKKLDYFMVKENTLSY